MHADHTNASTILTSALLDCSSNTRDQSASADRHDHGVDLRNLVEDFQRQGTLTGNDIEVIEGVDEHGTGVFSEPCGCAQWLVDRVTAQDDFSTVVAGGLQLGQGHAYGHENGGLDA